MQDADCEMCSAKLPALRVCRNSAQPAKCCVQTSTHKEGFHSCRVEALSAAVHANDTNK